MEDFDEKKSGAKAEFEAKTLEQSQKAEKEQVAVEDVRKKALEALVKAKKQNNKK